MKGRILIEVYNALLSSKKVFLAIFKKLSRKLSIDLTDTS